MFVESYTCDGKILVGYPVYFSAMSRRSNAFFAVLSASLMIASAKITLLTRLVPVASMFSASGGVALQMFASLLSTFFYSVQGLCYTTGESHRVEIQALPQDLFHVIVVLCRPLTSYAPLSLRALSGRSHLQRHPRGPHQHQPFRESLPLRLRYLQLRSDGELSCCLRIRGFGRVERARTV